MLLKLPSGVIQQSPLSGHRQQAARADAEFAAELGLSPPRAAASAPSRHRLQTLRGVQVLGTLHARCSRSWPTLTVKQRQT
jgi:hypothetical protein